MLVGVLAAGWLAGFRADIQAMQSESYLHAVPAEGAEPYSVMPKTDLHLPTDSQAHLASDQSEADPEPFGQSTQHLMHHHPVPLADYHAQISHMYLQQAASQPLLSEHGQHHSEHQRPDGMALPFPQSSLGVYAQAVEEQAAHAQAQHHLSQNAMPSQHRSEDSHYQPGSSDGLMSHNDPDRK